MEWRESRVGFESEMAGEELMAYYGITTCSLSQDRHRNRRDSEDTSTNLACPCGDHDIYEKC